MNQMVLTKLESLYSEDRKVQGEAYLTLLQWTDQPVDWAYEVWDDLVAMLQHKDNHLRSIASQLLCNLAKSDPQKRMRKDFESLFAVTKDDRFVTARHCLQAIWKVGVGDVEMREILIASLTKRFQESINEKNGTLVRFDIIQDFRKLYGAVKDETVKQVALSLIELEEDDKYRKKYASVWRKR